MTARMPGERTPFDVVARRAIVHRYTVTCIQTLHSKSTFLGEFLELSLHAVGRRDRP
jgi:hypothetical protein